MKVQIMALVLLLFSMSCTADDSWLEQQAFLTTSKVKTLFGNAKFEKEKFRTGSNLQRGEMAASLLLLKPYIGADFAKVIEDLGPVTGHFWADWIPAYLIDSPKIKQQKWQLVFLLSKDRKVSDIRVHKNG